MRLNSVGVHAKIHIYTVKAYSVVVYGFSKKGSIRYWGVSIQSSHNYLYSLCI